MIINYLSKEHESQHRQEKKKKKGSCTLGSSVETILITKSYGAKGNRPRYLIAKEFFKILHHFFFSFERLLS